jgi:hypothetical protein
VDSKHLSGEQIEAIENRLQPALEHLVDLMDRMSKWGLQQDRLFERASEARAALHDLLAELRTTGLAGVGNPRDGVPKRAR